MKDKCTRNGVGVIVDEEMKRRVIEMVENSDRVIMVKLVLGETVLNIVSAYVP